MLNNDLYNKLEKRFGKDQMINISEAVSYIYDILAQDTSRECKIGLLYDFEKYWWQEKFKGLCRGYILSESTFEGMLITKKDGTQEFIKNLMNEKD